MFVFNAELSREDVDVGGVGDKDCKTHTKKILKCPSVKRQKVRYEGKFIRTLSAERSE